MTLNRCKYNPTEDQKQNELFAKLAAVLAIVLALVPWGSGMPVAYKYPLWGISLALGLYLALTSIPTLANGLATPQKVAATICVLALTFTFCWPVIVAQRKKEKASALEGEIHPREKTAKQTDVFVQIGPSGGGMRFPVNGERDDVMKLLYNAGLRIEVKDGEILVSTPVRDRYGHLVATIDKNHWSVTSACLDKNYSRDSLEILDSRGLVVFQMRVLPDRVQLQGEWRDEFGNGTRLSSGKNGGGVMATWGNEQQELQMMELIAPMFKYPSANHWAEPAEFKH